MLTKKEITNNLEAELEKLTERPDISGIIEALVHYAEVNDTEITDYTKYLSQSIKDRIEYEAMGLNMLPKKNELPFD